MREGAFVSSRCSVFDAQYRVWLFVFVIMIQDLKIVFDDVWASLAICYIRLE